MFKRTLNQKEKHSLPTPATRLPLQGSERKELPGARKIGPANPNEQVKVSLYLRPASSDISGTSRGSRQRTRPLRLNREEYIALHSALPEDFAKIETFARVHGLKVAEKNAARRVIVLAGTVASMSKAFQVELHHYEYRGRVYRGRKGPIYLPADIAPFVLGVFGLDNRPQTRPHLRFRKTVNPADSTDAGTSYTPLELATLYDFPTLGDGSGQSIGIIEFGGGFQQVDLDAYFESLGIQVPPVLSVSVDGAQNNPSGDPTDPNDIEVMLDIEVAGAIAPGAKIVVYFAPNSDQGWIDAVTTAVFDTVNKPSVISISWGGAELYWTDQSMQAGDALFFAAGSIGVTVCCASGDEGSDEGVGDGLSHVDFPASSPNALGVGGTSLQVAGNTITIETVWNHDGGSSGGGISDVFDLPDWQVNMNVPPSTNPGHTVGRGVPDVAANADPSTGYQIRVDGQQLVVGGTSGAAPLWAGFLTLINEQLAEPVGYINPVLYLELVREANVVRDITSGGNGNYLAGPGWDACTGLGSPNGIPWLDAIIY